VLIVPGRLFAKLRTLARGLDERRFVDAFSNNRNEGARLSASFSDVSAVAVRQVSCRRNSHRGPEPEGKEVA
jgi:hypothetical protein